MEKQPLVLLAGPTGVGKTALSIELANSINAEIISCDSMQVYRQMDIGTAKITPEEMQGIAHYLIDVKDPTEEFNVSIFTAMAKDAIDKISSKGKIPLCVGGTGFYIQALLYDTEFSKEEGTSSVRAELESLAIEIGPMRLHEMLRKIDPVSADAIHPNNVKRVIRAIEYFRLHGEPISAHNITQRQKESPYNFCYFVLTDEREHLYANIDKRVDQMVEKGLFEEVTHLKELGCTRDMVSMQGLGYKEVLAYLDGEYTKEEAIGILKRDTRHFAKRQLTWFHSKEEVIWIDKTKVGTEIEAQLSFVLENLKMKGIIF